MSWWDPSGFYSCQETLSKTGSCVRSVLGLRQRGCGAFFWDLPRVSKRKRTNMCRTMQNILLQHIYIYVYIYICLYIYVLQTDLCRKNSVTSHHRLVSSLQASKNSRHPEQSQHANPAKEIGHSKGLEQSFYLVGKWFQHKSYDIWLAMKSYEHICGFLLQCSAVVSLLNHDWTRSKRRIGPKVSRPIIFHSKNSRSELHSHKSERWDRSSAKFTNCGVLHGTKWTHFKKVGHLGPGGLSTKAQFFFKLEMKGTCFFNIS